MITGKHMDTLTSSTLNESGSRKNIALALVGMEKKGDAFSYLQKKLRGEIARGRCVCRPPQVMAIGLASLVKSCRPASGPGLTMGLLHHKFLILSSHGSLLVQDYDLSKNHTYKKKKKKKKQVSSS